MSSIRSRQTGHVGSSIKDGVGGGNGFRWAEAGVKGSCASAGKDVFAVVFVESAEEGV